LEVVAKAIYPLHFYSGSSMYPTIVWIIFTRILNVMLASEYNCLVQLFNGLVQQFNIFFRQNYLNSLPCVCFYQACGAKTMCREWKGGDGRKKIEKHCFRPLHCI